MASDPLQHRRVGSSAVDSGSSGGSGSSVTFQLLGLAAVSSGRGKGSGGAGGTEEEARWVLGRKYDDEDLDGWTRHYRSLPWFTYRQGFRAMAPYPYTDDAGWGCMLRSAQMIMAQGLLRHAFGADWRRPRDPDDLRRNKAFCGLLRLFADHPGPRCLYSIHNMVQVGMSYDKLPGEWYGPSTAAYVLRDLAMVHRQYLRGGVRVLVTQAEVIYIDEVTRLCCPQEEEGTPNSESSPSNAAAAAAAVLKEEGGGFFDPLLHRPPAMEAADRKEQARREAGMLQRPWVAGEGVVILVPLRLGLASLNADYIPGLLAALQIPHSLGFVGGKPNHAIYFVGNRGTELVGLDPHTVQPAPEPPAPVVAASSGVEWGEEALDEEEEEEVDADGFAAVVAVEDGGAQQQPPPPPPSASGIGSSGNQQHQQQRRRRPRSRLSTASSSPSSLRTNGDADDIDDDPYVPSDAYVRSVQCQAPQLMQAKDLDPSLALGFYARNGADFEAFCRCANALRRELGRKGLPAPFVVEQSPPEYEGSAMVHSLAGMEGEELEEEGEDGGGHGVGDESDVEDEYVVL